MPFIYAKSAEFRRIEQELVTRGRAGRLGLDIMPVETVDAARVRWVQKDNYTGLQHLRGMDGQPTRITRVGEKTYEYEPGVFGEFLEVTESELTERSVNLNVDSDPIPVGDLVAEADEQLIGREWDRIESSIWTLLTTGTISIKIAGPNGTQVGYSDTYAIQTFTSTVAWTTSATATPLKDFQTVSQMGVGKGVSFGAGARAYMNSVTVNSMLNNTNQADLAGRRVEGGNTVDDLATVNRILVAKGAPTIVVYDEGYVNDANVYTKFIPDTTVVVIGQRRTGARIGRYVKTRNASNNFRPGSYRYVMDRANGGGAGGGNAEKRTPANLEVHRGHNGGPTMVFP